MICSTYKHDLWFWVNNVVYLLYTIMIIDKETGEVKTALFTERSCKS